MAGTFTPIFIIPGSSPPITPPPEQTAFRPRAPEPASAALPPPPVLPAELLETLSVEALIGRQHAAASVPFGAIPLLPTAATDPKDLDAPQSPVPAVPDPRYVNLVSRIANYYQQRTQAIAAYQEQRCRAWANMHRQKCQEMTKAATLVVAWYIRDRIGRRRRRQKRHFTSALAQRHPGTRMAKVERVRNWMAEIPEGPPSAEVAGPRRPESLADPAEAKFDVKDVAPDRDTRLWTEANALINANIANINVPFLGHLSFERSDSGSDDDDDDDDDDADYDCEDDEMELEDELGDGADPVSPEERLCSGDKVAGPSLPAKVVGMDLAPSPPGGSGPDAGSTSIAVQPGTARRRGSDVMTASQLFF